jgi:hypothetical protein
VSGYHDHAVRSLPRPSESASTIQAPVALDKQSLRQGTFPFGVGRVYLEGIRRFCDAQLGARQASGVSAVYTASLLEAKYMQS